MDKNRFPANSYIGTIELKSTIEFIENNFHRILSGMVGPGLLVQKLANGALDSSFQVSMMNAGAGVSTLTVNPGFAIQNIGGIARIFEFKGASFAINSSNFGANTYFVSLVTSLDNYEEGTISLTQGSDNVTISNGTFKHLRQYGSIIIDSDDGSSPVTLNVNEVQDTTARLSDIYLGTTKSNVKWRVGARFATNVVPQDTNSRLLYDYESCEVQISTVNPGIVLASLYVVESAGVLSVTIDDKRQDSLAVIKSNSANADDITSGINNDITTIEEKAQANRLDRIVSDFTTGGVRSSTGDLSISNDRYLTVKALVAYDGLGRRIELPLDYQFDLTTLVSQHVINEGTNPLYIYYKSPNSYDFAWNVPATKRIYVYLGEVTYTVNISNNNNQNNNYNLNMVMGGGGGGNGIIYGGNHFTVTTSGKVDSLKTTSFISEGRITPPSTIAGLDNTWSEGEIYYNPADKTCYYIRKKSDNISLEAVQMINTDILAQQINALKYQERLRFTLYPYESKRNWFLFNGVAAPCPIGYEFVIVEWRVGFYDVVDNPSSYYSVVDYMGRLSGSYDPKFTSENGKLNSPLIKTTGLNNLELSSTKCNPNSTVGIFFNGTATTRTIDLRVNGNNLDSIDMESEAFVLDGNGGTPTNKLYTAEVTIQLTSGARIINTQQNQT